ncbi:MAG: acyl carrier protein [Chloroflexi bacterium]|nr:acyl carrier protein [Chloroflexi bacterium CFX1]MCQ3952198.1 acyl carrier protein [Chloroflexota bacterium]MDL1918500.1 acyl carrier protein [Chloroflexi bacterium CFX5]NUQ58486.1 acyl carrier protein [Anaerolineales bacterium]RIK54544.1 MAG: acyl carrier protein [Chloroflexota bacterium]
MTEIENKIRKFLSENFILSEQANQLSPSDSFLEKGIIDSTGILELVFFVEDQFNVQIDTAEVLPENFDSIQNLSAYIRRKQGAG